MKVQKYGLFALTKTRKILYLRGKYAMMKMVNKGVFYTGG